LLSPSQITAFINANPQTFISGNTFDESLVLTAFGISTPNSATTHANNVAAYGTFQCQKLSAQNAINKVLATKGLYMKQHKYTNYMLLPATKIPKRIKGYAEQAGQKAYRGVQLRLGYNAHKAVW
jgi:hypothetical protein